MSNRIFYTVGIPVYNGSKFIKNSIESILNQSYQDFEIVISDNCSKDNTVEIIEKFTKRDKRIKLLKNRNHLKPVDNFKKTLSNASGQYFMWLSHDDHLDKDYLKFIKLKIEKENLAVFGVVKYVTKDGKIISKPQNNYIFKFVGLKLLKAIKFLYYPSLSGKMILFWSVYNTDKLKKISIFLHNYAGDRDYFDMPFVFNALKSFNFISCKNAIFFKTVHENSESFKYGFNKKNIYRDIYFHFLTIKSFFTLIRELHFLDKIFTIIIFPFGYFLHSLLNFIIYIKFRIKKLTLL